MDILSLTHTSHIQKTHTHMNASTHTHTHKLPSVNYTHVKSSINFPAHKKQHGTFVNKPLFFTESETHKLFDRQESINKVSMILKGEITNFHKLLQNLHEETLTLETRQTVPEGCVGSFERLFISINP